ncbi:MAG: hypothetical protein M0D54_11820 [Hyphomonadaceae bacterium JAD_PAG50586_4]|nr:MAG: hypothetical protein M0D54_11820 [Hyphomonadaceae bacterium JAD_PAG50586_4]
MLNDELISAFLDNELDAEQRAHVEEMLRRDKGAAARLERMRATDILLKRALPPVLNNETDAVAATTIRNGRVTGRKRWATQCAAIAASMLFGAFVSRWAGTPEPMHRAYEITPQQAHLLETAPSGAVRQVGAGSFEVVLSLQTEAGQLCRQFRLTRDTHSTDVLACRSEADAWRMVVSAAAARPEAYVPAGANSVLDAAIMGLGRVEVLDIDQERVALSRRRAPNTAN